MLVSPCERASPPLSTVEVTDEPHLEYLLDMQAGFSSRSIGPELRGRQCRGKSSLGAGPSGQFASALLLSLAGSESQVTQTQLFSGTQ